MSCRCTLKVGRGKTRQHSRDLKSCVPHTGDLFNMEARSAPSGSAGAHMDQGADAGPDSDGGTG